MMQFRLSCIFHALALLIFFRRVSSSQSLCHDGERTSLLQFKQSFRISTFASDDPLAYPKVASWASNSAVGDCCKWDGVECDGDTGYVIGLDLSSSFLYGSVGSNTSLSRLVHLTTLNLADNDFNNSRIPSSIKNLRRLTYLNLSNDAFSGQVPHEISELSRLSVLDFSSKGKDGSLEMKNPHILQNMTKLEVVSLDFVNISSVFPTFLTNFSFLVSLNLGGCGLHGDLPVGILKLVNLQNLNLRFNRLTGELPPFNTSSALTVLSVARTYISGELPDSIGALSSLVELDAHLCDLSGMIPQSFGNLGNLKLLRLDQNNFSGPIPSSLGNLTLLTILDLAENSFSGSVPSSLGNLTQLTILNLIGNCLNGPIPSSLGNLTQLIVLALSQNSLSGPLPDSFSKLRSLESLYLGSNRLNGTINFNVFLPLQSLCELVLANNNLTLLIKPGFNGTSAQLSVLRLSHCTLNGFPDFVRNQTKLEILALRGTGIVGPIPPWLMNTSTATLINLHLADNSFTGEVSPEICNFKLLTVLDLSENNLSGNLPPCLGNFTEPLLLISIKGNSFSGNIPEFGKSCQLDVIDFSYNRLQGKLPRSLQNCNMLEDLELGNNRLDDVFPHWLGTIRKLRILVLRSNRLHGVIQVPRTNLSFSQLRIIDISKNSFSGNLPSEFIQNMNAMNLRRDEELSYMNKMYYMPSKGISQSFMRYSFDATITIKGVRRHYDQINEDLVFVDFSSNNFHGEIPQVIGGLKGLLALNLSDNNLSGSIPSVLGNLPELESLDLSQNSLSGPIPEELAILNFLQYFNVSHNLLKGPIPQANQLSRFDATSYEGNSGLCGLPLSSKCANQEPGVSMKVKQKYSFGIGWEVVLLGYACGFLAGWLIGNSALAASLARFFK